MSAETTEPPGTTTPNGGKPEDSNDWRSIFDAPDFTALLRPAQTVKAREYSGKVKSVLKAGMVASINVGDLPDAAAILTHGPAFADAAGQFADSNELAANAIDIITSPGNPAVLFVMTAIPLVAQLFRNHEDVIKNIPEARKNARLQRKAMATARKAEKPRFTIRAFGREWPVRFRTPKVSKVFSGFRSQTRDPDAMTMAVFTDPAVIRALRKQGIVMVRTDEPAP
jgi:hypothetical protein